MKNSSLTLRAFLNSLGVLAYVTLIATFFFNANRLFGDSKSFLIPIAILLLLIVSATITGGLVLGKPIMLYLEGKKTDALKLFFYTIGWLVIIMIIVMAILAALK